MNDATRPESAWPALQAAAPRPLAELVPYARNARTHSPEQVEQIAASMNEFGVVWPALVDEAGEIIAGHGRLLAAEHNGWTEYPVVVARGWTPEQVKAYRLADNQLALNAAWDIKLLAAELDAIGSLKGLVGFSQEQLLAISAGAGNKGLTDPEETPPLPATPASVAGDLWVCGKHRLLCGSATVAADVARLLAGVEPSLMVTDPPYGVDYDPSWRARAGVNLNKKKLGMVANDSRADWREAWVLFPGPVAYVWHGGLHAGTVEESLVASGFLIRTQIIWAKDRFALSRGDYHWQHEPCWHAVRKGVKGNWRGDRSQSSVWQIRAREDSGHGHGTQKPVECMRRPIINNSSPGQAVYDPFNGSGTTMIAAEMEARCAYCIELDPGYVDVAVRRWQAFAGAEAILETSGESFAAVAAQRGVEVSDEQEKSAAQ